MQTTLTDDTPCAATGARFNLYRDIHKALRAALCHALVTVGRADAADDDATAATLRVVRDLLAMCTSHVAKENRFVHPAMEARRPGTSARITDEHVGHLQAIADLEEDVCVVEAASAGTRDAMLARLYAHLSLFVADNFTHMMVEETAHNDALWAAYTDAELLEIEGRILASIAPPEMTTVLRWMTPSITPAARAQLYGGMRAAMPAPMFAGILARAKSTLDPFDADKLDRALDAGPR